MWRNWWKLQRYLLVNANIKYSFQSKIIFKDDGQSHYSSSSCTTGDCAVNNKRATVLGHYELIDVLRQQLEKDEREGAVVPIFKWALLYATDAAVKDHTGEYTYLQLYVAAKRLAIQISNLCGSGACQPVAILSPNCILATLAQWACWISGQSVLILNTDWPLEWQRCLIREADVKLVMAADRHEIEARHLKEYLQVPLLVIDHTFVAPAPSSANLTTEIRRHFLQFGNNVLLEGMLNNDFYGNPTTKALYLPTAGTTGRPRCAIHTFRSLNAQINGVIGAWQLNSSDALLHAVNPPHAHALHSLFLCPHRVGAKLITHPDFCAQKVWSSLLSVNSPTKERPTVLVAAPSAYESLIAQHEKMFTKDPKMVEYIINHCRQKVRLMASSSAHLPAPIFRRWADITGHRLLQFYATVETGIVLTNSYCESPLCASTEANTTKNLATTFLASSSTSESAPIPEPLQPYRRRMDTVGIPVQGMRVRLVDNSGKVLIEFDGGTPEKPPAHFIPKTAPQSPVGELLVAGEQLFSAYSIDLLRHIKETILIKRDSAITTTTITSTIDGDLELAQDTIKKVLSEKPPEPPFGVNFDEDGFFATGDIVAFEDGHFRVLGQKLSNMIQSKNKRICGREIEEQVAKHPSVANVAILGLPDKLHGERIAALCVLRPDAPPLDLKTLNAFCFPALAPYKLPQALRLVDALPPLHNDVKTRKLELMKMFFANKN